MVTTKAAQTKVPLQDYYTSSRIVTGFIHANDAVATQVQADVNNVYAYLETQAVTTAVIPAAVQLGGQTFTPGVYALARCFR